MGILAVFMFSRFGFYEVALMTLPLLRIWVLGFASLGRLGRFYDELVFSEMQVRMLAFLLGFGVRGNFNLFFWVWIVSPPNVSLVVLGSFEGLVVLVALGGVLGEAELLSLRVGIFDQGTGVLVEGLGVVALFKYQSFPFWIKFLAELRLLSSVVIDLGWRYFLMEVSLKGIIWGLDYLQVKAVLLKGLNHDLQVCHLVMVILLLFFFIESFMFFFITILKFVSEYYQLELRLTRSK